MSEPGGHRVAVVGGGLAGITAALRCADAGRPVTVFESRRWLGGLTHSFRRGELWVDNGQHVFLRCCTAYLDLLRRLGVSDLVRLQPRLRIPVHQPGVPGAAVLERARLPAPLHLAGSVLRYRPLGWRERLGFGMAGIALRGVDAAAEATDRESFGRWLRRHGQSDRAIEALWDLVGVATLNARADDASLALAATVFQVGLLTDSAAADIGWSMVPLGQLHGEPALAALRRAGVDVRLSAPVRALAQAGGGWRVDAEGHDGGERFADVVLAVPPPAAEALLPDGVAAMSAPPSRQPGARSRARTVRPGWSAELGATPIVNVHVVLDRRVTDEPFLAGVGTEVQWVFDRTESSGLAVPGAQYLALSLSSADELVELPVRALRQRFLAALARLLPTVRSAEVLDFFVTRERHATFRQAPGSAALRPSARTGANGLFLAGAWTATGWPATMEGAVRSGAAAACALLGGTAESAARLASGSSQGSSVGPSSGPSRANASEGVVA